MNAEMDRRKANERCNPVESEGKGERPMTWRWRGESGKKELLLLRGAFFPPGGLCQGDPARSIATMPARQNGKPVAQKSFMRAMCLPRQ